MTNTFIDAKVDMPILSGAVLCSDGSNLVFGKDGGTLMKADGHKAGFIKRRGVYFMNIWVKKGLVRNKSTTFVRPCRA